MVVAKGQNQYDADWRSTSPPLRVPTSLVRRSFRAPPASMRFTAVMCKEWGTPGKEGRTQVHPEGG